MSRYKAVLAGAALAVVALAGQHATAQTAAESGNLAATLSSLGQQGQKAAEAGGRGALWVCASDVLKQDGRFGSNATVNLVKVDPGPTSAPPTSNNARLSLSVAFDGQQAASFGKTGAIDTTTNRFYKDVGPAMVVETTTAGMRYERELPQGSTNFDGPGLANEGFAGNARKAAGEVAKKVKAACFAANP